MPKSPFARIAITLPSKDLNAADRLARRLDRSRSWVFAEALRRFAAAEKTASDEAAGRMSTRSDVGGVTDRGGAGLGASRLAQLRRDMALTPEERIREAEGTLKLSSRRRPRRHRVLTFDRYEDFLDWQTRRDTEG